MILYKKIFFLLGHDRNFFEDAAVNNLLRRLFIFIQSNNELRIGNHDFTIEFTFLGLNDLQSRDLIPSTDPRFGSIIAKMSEKNKRKLRTIFQLFNKRLDFSIYFHFLFFLIGFFCSYNHCLWNVPLGIRKGQRHIMSRHLSKEGSHFIQKDELESVLNGLCLLVGCIVGKIFNICQLTKEDAQKYGVDQKKAKREWEILRDLDSNHYRNSLRAGNFLVGLIDNLVDMTREINPDLPHLSQIGAGSGRFLCAKGE